MSMHRKVFTATGAWVVPAGVKYLLLIGYGGGGGGAKPANGTNLTARMSIGGGGGGGAIQHHTELDVIPGSSYTITVGAGGAAKASAGDGNHGTDTTIALTAAPGVLLAKFAGARGGLADSSVHTVVADRASSHRGGSPTLIPERVAAANVFWNTDPAVYMPQPPILGHGPGFGGSTYGSAIARAAMAGATSLQGNAGGAAGANGSNSGSYYGGVGGGGGAGGPGGVGAAGGGGGVADQTDTGLAGTAGSDAAANTGAGGGGGGGGGCGLNAGGAAGNGGAGGSGKLIIIWWT